MGTNASDFSHDDASATVRYLGVPVAVKTKRGWTPITSNRDSVNRAVVIAIWSMPNDASAGELRRRIAMEM